MDTDALKTILAGIVRHALTMAGGMLVTDGYMQSTDAPAFIGGGMVIAGMAWSWWQKSGQAQTAGLLKKLTATKNHADAVDVAQAMPPATTSAVNKAVLSAIGTQQVKL